MGLKSSSASKSSSATKSSTSSSVAKLRARVAELLVERKMLDRVQKLKAAEEQLALHIKIEKARAKEKVYAGLEDDPNKNQLKLDAEQSEIPEHSNFPLLRTPDSFVENCKPYKKSSLDPSAAEFKPSVAPTFTKKHSDHSDDNSGRGIQQEYLGNIVDSYHQLTTAMSLPQPKVPVFKGDPTEYASFVTAFNARIDSKVNNDSDRLYYLDQHLEGEPKDLIEGCLYLEPSEGYAEARMLLHLEYGDSYKIAMAYINQVLSWPSIKHDDSNGIRKLSLFLLKCKNAMKNVQHLEVLNHAPNMQAIVQKLPYHLQNKWCELATKKKRQECSIASFSDLVEFLISAADTANHPIYGKEALKIKDGKSKETRLQRTSKSSSFATQVVATGRSVSSNSEIPSINKLEGPVRTKSDGYVTTKLCNLPPNSPCPFCKNLHDIDNCKEFGKLSMQEKKDFLKKNFMCFSCYCKGHVSKGCTNRRTCKVCNKYGHPSALHIEGFTPDKGATKGDDCKNTALVNTARIEVPDEDLVVIHTILPVKVTKGDKSVVTYAFYDGGSGGCFMSEELQRQLNISGEETTLQLGTMNGKKIIRTKALNGLVVTDLNDDNAIRLPRTFTTEQIPVHHHQIPKPEVVRRWKHLEDISNEIPEYRPDLKVGILIGSNCSAAFEPLQVLPSQREGPFAVRLRHGWTISTPLRLDKDVKSQQVISNRLALTDSENVKEIIAPESFLKMFELDFKDCSFQDPTSRGISQEDKKFLKIIEQSTQHVDGHYEVPLPFRQSNVALPNNKEQALQRAQFLKRKLQKNEHYLAD